MRLNICGYCGKKVDWCNISKVILCEHGNLLCDDCKEKFWNAVAVIAKKYLDKEDNAVHKAWIEKVNMAKDLNS